MNVRNSVMFLCSVGAMAVSTSSAKAQSAPTPQIPNPYTTALRIFLQPTPTIDEASEQQQLRAARAQQQQQQQQRK